MNFQTYVYMRSRIGDLTSYSSKEKVFYIKDKTINFTTNIVDSNLETVALTGDDNILIKGFSNAAFTVTAAPATIGSNITAQSIKSGSYTYTTTSGTFAAIDNGTFTVSATDTRGNSSTKTITKTIIDYVPLTCNLSVDMSNIQGEASFNITGNYFSGSFGAVDNELTVFVRQIFDGVEGEWQEVGEVSASGNTFTASGTLSGFTQDKACIVEAKVTDKLLTKETKQNVLIIPVFDWSKEDFNFNVPVTIQGNLTVKGSVSYDKGQDILWSGAYCMLDSETAELTTPISEQANGIVLVFSRYENELAQDYGWNSFYIPKTFTSINNGGEHNFIMASSGFATIATKNLFIADNTVKGNIDNNLNGTNNGITFNNNGYVLRYIIGV